MGKNRHRRRNEINATSPIKAELPTKHKGFPTQAREVLMLFFLSLLVFLIYSNTLQTPFVFDDVHNIQNNPHMRLTRFTLGGVTKAGFESPTPNRPVANISFALNYYFHQYRVKGYHLINILIHISTGILLYLFVKTTLGLPLLRSRFEHHQWIALATALIWLVNPIQTQSITYIVQRMNSMAAMFYILSLLLYVKGRLEDRRGKRFTLFAGCTLAGIMSLGSKEIAATLPVFIFLYEWYFLQDLSRAWVKRHLLPLVGLLALLVIVIFVYLGTHPLDRILRTYQFRDFTLIQRVLTEFRVVIFYVSLLIFPHPSRLNLDHDFPLSYSLFDPPSTLATIATVAGFIVLAIYMAKKDRLLSFCILWFFGNLVIESSVIGLEIVFEHRTYLPSTLGSLAIVTLAYRYLKSKGPRVGILFLVVMVFSFWTYQRNSVWSDDITLWRDCVKKSPKKARPHLDLGVSLYGRGKIEEAMAQYYEALRIKPDCAEAHNNLGAALDDQGRVKEAMKHYAEAVRIKPNYGDAHNNLGVLQAKEGKLKEAIWHFSEALRINPEDPEVHFNLGNALASQGRLKEAVTHFSAALRLQPDDSEARRNLDMALQRLAPRSPR